MNYNNSIQQFRIKCVGCNSCAQICSKSAIHLEYNDNGFLYPIVSNNCVNCGKCKTICPVASIKIVKDEINTKAIALQNPDKNIRLNSSSGGAFSIIANKIIENGGVVFGVSMSQDFKFAEHIIVENKEDLWKIRGSKYIQSNTNNTYSTAKKILKSGKLVLYSGTPCEIAGLKAFLNKDYENLYTVDLICHGSPSPIVWKKYLEEKENISNSKTKDVFFRNKAFGWQNYSLNISFCNGTSYSKKIIEDTYLRGFVSNLFLRKSCYDCQFKGLSRMSDFTLADFWGGQNIVPSMNDDTGISLVIIHTRKGEELIKNVDCAVTPVDVKLATRCNKSILFSSPENINRKYFYKLFKKNIPISTTIEKSLKHNYLKRLFYRCLTKAKNILEKK